MSELESIVCDLNTQNAAQAKELRQLRADKAALEQRVDRVSSDLASAAEQLRDTRRALDQTRAELTRTQRESEAKLAALDADAKQAVSRAQQAASELKAQLQPAAERLARSDRTIEQQRAEYTKIVAAEREASALVAKERERYAAEARRVAALLADKANADERLAGHEQIIEDLQQRLQAESGVIRAAGAKEKETRATLERERETAANAERTLRRRVVELEQAAVETQTRHDATLLHLRVEHERALSTSSVLTMQDELNQLRTSLTTAVAEARAEATRTAQQASAQREHAWADERRRLERSVASAEERAARAEDKAIIDARAAAADAQSAAAKEIERLSARLETIEDAHAREMAQVKSDLYDKLTAERSLREAIEQRSDSMAARAADQQYQQQQLLQQQQQQQLALARAQTEAAAAAAAAAAATNAAAAAAAGNRSSFSAASASSAAQTQQIQQLQQQLAEANEQLATAQSAHAVALEQLELAQKKQQQAQHEQQQQREQQLEEAARQRVAAEVEEMRRDHEREVMRAQTKLASERVEWRKVAETEKQEAADAMRLQFREESAMLLLSFEQQTQALQLQLQQTEEQLAALRQSAQQRPGALVASSSSSASFARSAGTMSLPQTPQRSRTPSLRVNSRPQLQQNSGHNRNASNSQRGADDGSDFDDSERGSFASPASYHSTASTAAADDAASLHAGLNLLSSSAGDLRARSVLMAADRRATLSSLEAFGAALVLHSGSATSPAADSGSASGHGAVSSSGGLSHVRSGVQSAVGNATRRGTVPLLPDEVDDTQQRNGLGVDEADLQFRLAPWPSAFVAVAATDLRREPVMQYDDSGDACTLCTVQFRLLTRRHHCRACGYLFCSYCSGKSSIVLWRGDKEAHRVCDICVLNIRFATKGAIWK